MQKLESTALKKSLRGDTVCAIIVTALSFLASALSIFQMFTNSYGEGAPSGIRLYNDLSYIQNALTYALIGVAHIFLCRILFEIHRTGKPFSKTIILSLRTMAWLIFAGACSPVITMAIGFFAGSGKETRVTFVHFNLFMFIFAVILFIISEIFRYGWSLQEDVDSIA